MASKIRTTTDAVKALLVSDGAKYSYFQAVRLLRRYDGQTGERHGNLRIRPRLGLGFPENDIDAIEVNPDDNYRITANFFGLYGVASPLPAYYTEDLLEEEREGHHVMRGFLDIVHYAMYPLLFDAWEKYRLEQRIVEDRHEASLNQLYAFVGLHGSDLRAGLLPGSAALLRHAGLFNQRPHSALGLKTLLADVFAPAQLRVVCGIWHSARIPDEQRWRLGQQQGCLGEDAWVGAEIDDWESTIRIEFGGLPQALFRQMLPGGSAHARLRFFARFYLAEPLEVDIELQLRHDEADAARTGVGLWSRLGFDTWLNPRDADLPARVQYRL
ncbi:type VI secretion system baseplate subunit TssG [Paraburkholderia sp. UYCP14C]|uniref:type VI secretion system baseplate subunit TssG n=1 Tax=Paraburkholderia sp. UYCP14C TaxID=2511130 RepID=UPI001020A7CA|nr:type VI secretion system baseplate subunit TssG [Paraburkholderia sp. UYCP14C]RZF23597.1 type VI secretion system baseplate subunit TssG [Paraburkholderia sp. UYCP14C]